MGEQLSGSRLPIARHCRYSFRDDVSFPDNRAKDDDADASAGTRNHDLFAEFVEKGRFPPLTPSERVLCDHVRDFWGERTGRRWEVEGAYVLNAQAGTVRYLGARIGRKYGELAPGEVPLTIDYAGYDGDMLVLGDWKGFGAHVESPAENLQLLAGACAVALYAKQNGRSELGPVQLEIPHVTETGLWCEREVISSLRLMAAMREIATIIPSIPGSEPSPGDHCRYCNANGACPATSETVTTLAKAQPGALAVPRWTSEFISVENDRLLVEQLGPVKKAIEAIERKLKERAAEHPIDMGDGTVYKPVVCRRNVPDTKAIEAKLGDEYLKYTKLLEYEQFRRVKA